VTAVETCKAAGVPRFVFVSATIPAIPGLGEQHSSRALALDVIMITMTLTRAHYRAEFISATIQDIPGLGEQK
jgi:hypothetical protein